MLQLVLLFRPMAGGGAGGGEEDNIYIQRQHLSSRSFQVFSTPT
jgi:hypothetical protein